MKRTRILRAIAALLACCAGGALAQQAEKPKPPPPVEVVVPHWYVGIGAAQTIFDIAPDAVATPGATDSTLNAGMNQTGYRGFGGYRFHRNFAVEGAYTDYGKFTATRENIVPGGGSLVAQTRIRGASLELVALYPFNNGFSVFGKGGGMLVQAYTQYKAEDPYMLPATSKTSVRTNELVGKYGVGLGYAVTPRIGLRMEYEVAKKVGEEIEGDVKALFFSVQVRLF